MRKETTAGKIVPMKPANIIRPRPYSNPPFLHQQKPVKRRERQAGDGFFLMTERGIIRNPEYREVFKARGRAIVYEHLWANLVRGGWKDDERYPIKRDYFDNGLLAYCSSYRHVGRQCGIDKNTVEAILKEFNEMGIINLTFIMPEGMKHYQFVAVLGMWELIEKDGELVPKETLLRDQVFLAPKADDEQAH